MKTDPEYELYTIFSLASLHIFDGKSISKEQTMEACAKYEGKLHDNFLQQKLGHLHFDILITLDLTSWYAIC